MSLAVVAIVGFQFLIEPEFLARFPSTFPEPSVSETGRALPDTRAGWAQVPYLLAVTGPFYHYRIYRTALGKRLREAVLTERRGDRQD